MRKFKIGDRVRWYEIDGRPLWNFDTIEEVCSDSGRGRWIEGVVTSATDAVFDADGSWEWPQPAHCRSMYGELGYLELVEAAPEPEFEVRRVPKDGCWYVGRIGGGAVMLFPGRCINELEAVCKKLNKEHEKKEGTP